MKQHWNNGMRVTVIVRILAAVLATVSLQQTAIAGPEDDRLGFVAFFEARFPDIPVAEFANGIYAIDSDAREQWYAIEDFPPYEFTIDEGDALWQEDFSDGKSYADCFSAPVANIRPHYPLYDDANNSVVTLDVALNDCRVAHGQPPLPFDSGEIIAITAFLAFAARGEKLDIQVPEDNAGAVAAYEAGKRFYYTKRGQLNFACSDCHGISSGLYIRADRLSAGLGHPTHFPVYRSKTGGMVSLQQRFSGCVRDVRATPFDLQSREFRNLEYFLTFMSNGMEVNGPGSRK